VNFLQLVQFAHRQIGVGGEFVGTTPLDVTVPFGPLAELSASINDAYKDIQAEQSLWRFRTLQGTLTVTNGVRTLSKAVIRSTLSLYERMLPFVTGGGRYIRSYDSVIGSAQSSYCFFVNYQNWRGFRDFGSIPSGQPQSHTIRPDETLELYPISDTQNSNASQYVLAFDYLRTCDVLISNGSVPIFPSEWHEAIAWRGVQYWGRSRKDSGIYSSAKVEFERCMNALRRTELHEPLLVFDRFYN
jgi:hypothetical protein